MKVIAIIIIVTLTAAGLIIHEIGAFVDDVRGDEDYVDRE